MLTPDTTGYRITPDAIRARRTADRQAVLQQKRLRTTEMLPEELEEDHNNGNGGNAQTPFRQALILRNENQQLRQQLELLQEQLDAERENSQALENAYETYHQGKQQEVEQYHQQLRDMMEELREKSEEHRQQKDLNDQWEARYQDLYHGFQTRVEEEARKIVAEAAQTLIISPGHTPALLSDVVNALEERLAKVEDQRTAELTVLMRQAHQRAQELEREVAKEQADLAAEKQHLIEAQNALSQTAKQRYEAEQQRLQARWSSGLTFITLFQLGLMVGLELFLFNLKFPLLIVLFAPMGLCLFLSYWLSRLYTKGRVQVQKSASQKAGLVKGQMKKTSSQTGAKPAAG